MIHPDNSKSASSIRIQRNDSGNAVFVLVKKPDFYSILGRLEFKNSSNDWILEGARFVDFQRHVCSLGVSPCIDRNKPSGDKHVLLSIIPDKISFWYTTLSLGFSVDFAANSSSKCANPMSRRGRPASNMVFAVSHRSHQANKLDERRNLQPKEKARQGSRKGQEKPRMENQMN
jgi:hypothetical protein